mmetsp:Transcript_30668/g.74067  ORF Transcript_30668/g.74067 Transcript_30668/m.74067 type:complete len:244 (+) Transcript_30668:1588-2319(+)
MINVLVINGGVVHGLIIELPNPIGRPDGPVLERREVAGVCAQAGRPLESEGLAGVVEPVLGVPLRVHVEEDGEAVGSGPVEEAVEVVDRSVGASDIRSIRLEHEVTDRYPQRIHRPAPRQVLDDILRHPRLPMPPELLVPLLRSQNLAERVVIHPRGAHASPQKLVEQRGRDPRLEDQPSSEVDAAYLIVERQGVLVGGAGLGGGEGLEVLEGYAGVVWVGLVDGRRGGGGSGLGCVLFGVDG